MDVPKLLLRGECYVEWEEEEDGSEIETVPRGEGGGGVSSEGGAGESRRA